MFSSRLTFSRKKRMCQYTYFTILFSCSIINNKTKTKSQKPLNKAPARWLQEWDLSLYLSSRRHVSQVRRKESEFKRKKHCYGRADWALISRVLVKTHNICLHIFYDGDDDDNDKSIIYFVSWKFKQHGKVQIEIWNLSLSSELPHSSKVNIVSFSVVTSLVAGTSLLHLWCQLAHSFCWWPSLVFLSGSF